MRPSVLPNLIEAAGRNARQGFADVALFEVGPVFFGDRPAATSAPRSPRIVAPQAPRALGQGRRRRPVRPEGRPAWPCWRRWARRAAAARAERPPGVVVATRAARRACSWAPRRCWPSSARLHPAVLKALRRGRAPVCWPSSCALEAVPEPKQKASSRVRPFSPSPLMPLTRDFAFVADTAKAAGDLVRAAARRRQGADRRRAGVRRLSRAPACRGRLQVGRPRGGGPAARQDPDRGRDRSAVPGGDRLGGQGLRGAPARPGASG